MLTRTFLLTWYTAMMTRIDKASIEIKNGFHETHQKITDPLTKNKHIRILLDMAISKTTLFL